MIEADSVHSTPRTNPPIERPAEPAGELCRRTGCNVIQLSARRPLRALPPENVQAVDFPVTSRQLASRQRNPLRHPCNRVSIAVTVAGKLQRGEALRVDPYLDEGALLWNGVEAARLLLAELFELAVTQGGRARQ
jgi:hypothetical protein